VGAFNSAHIFGTLVPVEEPSTASKGDISPDLLFVSLKLIAAERSVLVLGAPFPFQELSIKFFNVLFR
jgi:hypothetical protein